MDITTLIVRDHDTVFAMIHALEDALEPKSFLHASAKTQAHAIVEELQIHARAEELSLYAALLDLKDAPPTVLKHLDHQGREGVFEHKAIDDAGARLVALVDDDTSSRVDIIAQLTVLKEILEHHARKEEEQELLPEVKKRFSTAEREALGGEMESLRMALTKGPKQLHAEAVLVG
ncbi:MAG TPA: hemerythrin domain-containing protein [Myxococcota bacterium]